MWYRLLFGYPYVDLQETFIQGDDVIASSNPKMARELVEGYLETYNSKSPSNYIISVETLWRLRLLKHEGTFDLFINSADYPSEKQAEKCEKMVSDQIRWDLLTLDEIQKFIKKHHGPLRTLGCRASTLVEIGQFDDFDFDIDS